MPGVSGVTVVTMLVCFVYFAREAAGALGARHSLRPLLLRAAKQFCKTRAHRAARSRRCDVIARSTTLGNASKVTLADAKIHARKVFDLAAAKINPATQRTKAAVKASQTFDRYVDPFLAALKIEWAAKYYNDNARALK